MSYCKRDCEVGESEVRSENEKFRKRNRREEEEVLRTLGGSPNGRFPGRQELTFLPKSALTIGEDLGGSWSNAKEVSFFFFWRGVLFFFLFSLVFLGSPF